MTKSTPKEKKNEAPNSGNQNLKRRNDFFPDINANGFVMSENTFPSLHGKVMLDNPHNFAKYLDKIEAVDNLDSGHALWLTADSDLLTLMTRRLYKAEEQLSKTTKELQSAIAEVREKEEEILELKIKIEELEKRKPEKDLDLKKSNSVWSGKYQHLLQSCLRYRKQVVEMESFLADYGLVWVGEDGSGSMDPSKTFTNIPVKVDDTMATQDVNFDLLLKRLNELNIIEGEPKICYTNEGATFKSPESVPLTLYANGMVLFSGPFRKYSEPLTQEFLLDVIDGYYPSELQERYPDGVAFQVVDKHTVPYSEKEKSWVAFSGHGYRLGSKPRNLDQCSKSSKSTSFFEEIDNFSSACSSDDEAQKAEKFLMDYVTGLCSGKDLKNIELKTSDLKKVECSQSKHNLKSRKVPSEQSCRKKKKKVGSQSNTQRNLKTNVIRNSSLPKLLPNVRRASLVHTNVSSVKSSSSKLDAERDDLTGDKIRNLIDHESTTNKNIFKEMTGSVRHYKSEFNSNLEEIILPTTEYSCNDYSYSNCEKLDNLISNEKYFWQNLCNQGHFEHKHHFNNFQLGWSPEMKLLVEEDAEKEKVKRTIEERLTKLTTQQLLKKLPQVIIRNGKLITVRAEIEELLKDSCDMAIRVQNIISEAVKSGKESVSLRIRYFDGQLVFMVKISPQESVGNLRQLLNEAMSSSGMGTQNYTIVARYIFPKTIILSECEKTLRQYGLNLNSVLTLQRVL